MSRIDAFLELAVKQGGSDLHLIAGESPRVRINGTLHRIRFRELSNEDLTAILNDFMTERHWHQLEFEHNVDLAYQIEGLGRFRANVYHHLDGLAAVLRVIPTEPPKLEDLDLPRAVGLISSQPKGLTLVTGPTGCGKSTTLAAMVDHINHTRRNHIVTVEDPIEFVHHPALCAVTQREVGDHAPGFAEALRVALREDPDVLLVGELRDMETISMALTAAETGVQVLGTLHTTGAARSIDRIVNVFPSKRQDQVRTMLAESLCMLISQQLVVLAEEERRTVAAEVLVNTPAASAIIRSGQSHKLNSVIQSGGRVGMQSLDAVLKDMVLKGTITAEEAYEKAMDRGQFERLLAGAPRGRSAA